MRPQACCFRVRLIASTLLSIAVAEAYPAISTAQQATTNPGVLDANIGDASIGCDANDRVKATIKLHLAPQRHRGPRSFRGCRLATITTLRPIKDSGT